MPKTYWAHATYHKKKHNSFSTCYQIMFSLSSFPIPSISFLPEDYGIEDAELTAFMTNQEDLGALSDFFAPFLSSPLSGSALPVFADEEPLDMLSLFLDEAVVAPRAVRPAPPAAKPAVIVIDDSDDEDTSSGSSSGSTAQLQARLSKRMAIDRTGSSFRVCMPDGSVESYVSVLAAMQAHMLYCLPTGGRPDLAALFARDGSLGRVSGPALRQQFRLTLRNEGLPEFPAIDGKFSGVAAEFVITARAVDDLSFRTDCCLAARLGLTLATPCGGLMVKLGRILTSM